MNSESSSSRSKNTSNTSVLSFPLRDTCVCVRVCTCVSRCMCVCVRVGERTQLSAASLEDLKHSGVQGLRSRPPWLPSMLHRVPWRQSNSKCLVTTKRQAPSRGSRSLSPAGLTTRGSRVPGDVRVVPGSAAAGGSGFVHTALEEASVSASN